MKGLSRRDMLAAPASALAMWALPTWAQSGDSLAWLEAAQGEQALAWVRDRNAETLALVGSHPEFARRRDDVLASQSASDNVPVVSRHGDHVYNFYRTARRPHGQWRRTTPQSYAQDKPSWQVLLNVDDLAKEEMRSLVFTGAQVHEASQRALVFFSAGGEDKVEMREFDLASRGFVAGGFNAPTAKMRVSWFGPDELLIATYTGPDSLTASGYPLAIRRWKRGTPLLEAPEVLRGEVGDVMVTPNAWRRGGLAPLALLERYRSFFVRDRWLLGAQGEPVPVDLPRDASAWIDHEWLVLSLSGAWRSAGREFPPGSMLAMRADEVALPTRQVHVLLEGGERRRSVRTEKIKDGFLTAYADNLRPRLVFQRWDGSRFEPLELPVPAHGLASIAADEPTRSNRFWLTTQAPVTPFLLRLVDAAAPGETIVRKAQPAAFDATGMVVEQFEARSRDGTLVPYTVVAARERKPGTPTLLYGYGGFGLPLELDYQRWPGIGWLKYGGTFVMAHIRGGGEFGTAWYEAAKGTKRQKAFDDFIAVAEDLARRGIAEPHRLGIYGASNGGALVSAVMVQRPELFGAVVSRVPLTDLLGFTKLFAGPSWVEEYGDPDQPDDRASLARWSPLQNARSVDVASYPPVLYIGNRNDDRVHPAHARKMVARLRALGHRDSWLYEEVSGGHSGRTDPHIFAQREALLYTFLWSRLTASTHASSLAGS